MESDDDYQHFSPPEEPSSPINQRKLKRLKKAIKTSNQPISQPIDANPSSETTDFAISSNHQSPQTLDVEKPVELFPNVIESEGFDDGRDLDDKLDDLFVYRDRLENQTVVDAEREYPFGVSDAAEEKFEGKEGDAGETLGDEKMEDKEKIVKKRRSLKVGEGEKTKKKRSKKSVDEKGNSEASARATKKLEKERKTHLEQLHAESQRLLRETRDAAFKPVPVVQKPISSILEKIRQRKLDASKKASMLNNHVEASDFSKNVEIDLYPEHASTGDLGDKKHIVEVAQEKGRHLVQEECNGVDTTHTESSNEPAPLPSRSKSPILSNTDLDEESKREFRAPIDDTQDLFSELQESEGEDLEDSMEDNPVEEVLEPSTLTLNLMLDSAPPDDVSSDDEENDDKENIDPQPRKPIFGDLYPKGGLVKAFLDDEAEEDDSDNDLMQFKENEEEEENEDSEEFNDLIATGYEEKPSDNVKRDQLHQMWLEQQDAAATDNVLQRLKCNGKQRREPNAFDEIEEDEGDSGEDSMDEAAAGPLPASAARMHSKRMKQMIPQMFTDKDDDYISSDDEETEQKLVKMRLLERAEAHGSFLSPAEDENSREVFGLIKKLNIAPDPKKKPKSFFGTLLTGGNSNSSSKSSFLGRAPTTSIQTSNKGGSSNFRSFIFGRDDSNSRSAITSEGSSDVGENSNRPTKTGSAKFISNSQAKLMSQTSTKTSSSSSLLDILRKSTQSDNCARSDTIGQTQVAVQFAAFKSVKRSLKIESRN